MLAWGELDRVAVIDLGSNTARLVAFGYVPGHGYRVLDELRQVVRLYSGLTGSGHVLQPAAEQRAICALDMFASYCRTAGIRDVIATATSAVRDAANGAGFLQRVRTETGLELSLLDADQEAAAGVLAAANSSVHEDALVLDIGGGSAQLSYMQGRRYVRGRSFPLGAVRLSEEFLRVDPPGKSELSSLAGHIDSTLQKFMADLPRGLPLLGMGGTIRNLARIRQVRSQYPVRILHGYRLTAAAAMREVRELADMSLAERRRVQGLNPDRADIIVAGALVLAGVMKAGGVAEVTVSGQGMREGLFYPRLFPESPGHMTASVSGFSVLNLMRRYPGDYRHNEHVRDLALMLFDQLQEVHGLGPEERRLLSAAALLHDIGVAINYFEHHLHSEQLILNSGLPGFDHRQLALIALTARHHRKGRPTPQELGALLRKGDQRRLELLTGMLRLAESLERGKSQRVRALRCQVADGVVQVEAFSGGDAGLEVAEAQQRSDLLSGVLHMPLKLREVPQ